MQPLSEAGKNCISIKTEVMQQIGIDTCSLREVDGFKQRPKPIKDKSVSTIGQVLYEIHCRYGCMKIQINNHCREFVNKVSKVLDSVIGTDQCITSTYHPQSNGLCERQNGAIKELLVKFLTEISVTGPT